MLINFMKIFVTISRLPATWTQTCNLSQTLHGYDFTIIFSTQETRKLRQPTFSDKTAKTVFQIINIYTQGYFTLNKYVFGIDSIGLPKVNLWATKCVTKRQKATKAVFFGKTPYVQSKNLLHKINILQG